MYIKLFDIQGETVTPTNHCYTIEWLKVIIEKYPKEYNKIFAYLQYMCSWNPEDNPYLAMKEEDREETILKDIKGKFSTEDDLIQVALKNCKKLFELPTYRIWKAAKVALDNIAGYLETTKPTSGKDGSNADIRATMKDYPALCDAYNKGYKAFMDEVKITIRGDKFDSQI